MAGGQNKQTDADVERDKDEEQKKEEGLDKGNCLNLHSQILELFLRCICRSGPSCFHHVFGCFQLFWGTFAMSLDDLCVILSVEEKHAANLKVNLQQVLGGNLQHLACDFRVTSWCKADACLGRHPKGMGYSDGCHGKAEVTRLASAKRAGTWRRKVSSGAERRIGG